MLNVECDFMKQTRMHDVPFSIPNRVPLHALAAHALPLLLRMQQKLRIGAVECVRGAGAVVNSKREFPMCRRT